MLAFDFPAENPRIQNRNVPYTKTLAFIMKKNIAILLILVLSLSSCHSQIPIEKFRVEIEKLDTEKQISEYWNNLHKIDQEILISTSNLKIADSISISNMVRETNSFLMTTL